MASTNGLITENNFPIKGKSFGVKNGVITHDPSPYGYNIYESLDIVNTGTDGRNYTRMVAENGSSWLTSTSVGAGVTSSFILENVESVDNSGYETALEMDFDPTAANFNMYMFKSPAFSPKYIIRSEHNAATYESETITIGDVGTTLVLPGAKINMNGSALGDILYHDGTSFVRLPIGSAGQVLTVSAGGIPSWV